MTQIFRQAWSEAPAHLRIFLDRAIESLVTSNRIVGVCAGGSLMTGAADAYSDLDLVVVVEDSHYDEVMKSRREIVAGLGRLVSAFVGDHVGEPRLLICLFADPLLHVDFKFVTLGELSDRVEDPLVLADRGDLVKDALAESQAVAPTVAFSWLADRVWTWIHYGAVKAERGELFESLDMIAFLRARVLGPMALAAAGHSSFPGQGLRRLERKAPAWSAELAKTTATHDRDAAIAALTRIAMLYIALRDALQVGSPTPDERAVLRYLDAINRLT